MAKWKITVQQKKQRGQLDKVRDFLKGSETLAGFGVITPITQDQKIVITHAPDLASETLRSMEIMWNKKSGRLTVMAVSGREDVPNFKNSIKLCYPNCDFGPWTKR